MKRWLGWRPSGKILAGVFVAILVLTLIPLLRLTWYTVPWYDDYLYGKSIKLALETGGGLPEILKGAWNEVRTEWYAFQGTYASIFLMAFMPAAFGEQYYFIGSVILILLPVLAVFALIRVLAKDVFGFDRFSVLCLQSALSTVVLMFLYTAKEGFYWYDGGIHYVGMHSFALLFIAAAVKLLKTDNRAAKVLLVPATMLGALVAAGSNFVTTLQGLLLILSVVGIGILCKNRRALLLIPCVLVYVEGFHKNIFAPGNARRMDAFDGWGYGPLESVFRSFWEAFLHLGEFSGLITIAVMILLAPVIWQAVRESKYAFRCPGLVTAWSFCLYATGFTPSLYSLGHAGLSRTLNAVKITYQLLLFLNEIYWFGYFCRLRERKGKKVPSGLCPWWFYPGMGAVMLLIFSCASNQAGNYSAYGAYYYVHTGEAYNFRHEYLDRVARMEGDEPDVVVEPYKFRPWFLCMGDWSENAENDINCAVALWFRKETVRCVAQEQGVAK